MINHVHDRPFFEVFSVAVFDNDIGTDTLFIFTDFDANGFPTKMQI